MGQISLLQNDPVVMGLLKSTMFPLQQVLEGNILRITSLYFRVHSTVAAGRV